MKNDDKEKTNGNSQLTEIPLILFKQNQLKLGNISIIPDNMGGICFLERFVSVKYYNIHFAVLDGFIIFFFVYRVPCFLLVKFIKL